MRLTRHFHRIDGRHVHYRRCGQGPALVLLHASPVSSKVFEPMMRFYARHYTTFAFDTPGNGLSDPLSHEDPDMTHYADAQAALLRDIGIEHCLVYGRHTGASIGMEMANRHPDLVSMVLTNGYPVFTPEQRKAYLSGYLSDMPVNEDGSHLTWLWSRYRDQFLFWPWSKKLAENRADCDMPDLDFIHDGVMDLMEAGNNYKAPYRAVFKHEAMEALNNVTVPVCAAARQGDSLYSRLANFPDNVWTEDIARDPQEALVQEAALLAKHAPKKNAPKLEASPDLKQGLTRDFVDTGTEQLHVISTGQSETLLILVGEAPGAISLRHELIEKLGADGRVLAIDPAGCGESEGPSDGDLSQERQADRICAVLKHLGIEQCEVAGLESGAGIALEVVRRLGNQTVRLIDPFIVADNQRVALARNYADDATPKMEGTHLLSLWREVRDGAMYFPWFDNRRVAAHEAGHLNLDFESMTAKVLAFAKQGQHHQALWQAVWGYPLIGRMNGLKADVKIILTGQGHVPIDAMSGHEGLNCVNVKSGTAQDIAQAVLKDMSS